MMVLFAFAIISSVASPSLSSNADDKITAIDELISVLSSKRMVDDIEFVYEGNLYSVNGGGNDSERIAGFSGNYINRMKDEKEELCDDTYIDVYTKKANDATYSMHVTMAKLEKEVQTFTHPTFSSPAPKNITTKRAKAFGNFRYYYSPELTINIFPVSQLLKYSKLLKNEFSINGYEQLDGESCLLITRNPNANSRNPGNTSVLYHYWLSPSHDYQVKKYEKIENGTKIEDVYVSEYIDIKYTKRDKKIGTLWFPLVTDYSSYVDGIDKFSKTPILKSHTFVLKETLVVNNHPTKDRFSIFYSHTEEMRQRMKDVSREFNYYKAISGQDLAKTNNFRKALEAQLEEVNSKSEEINLNTVNSWGFNTIFNKWTLPALLAIISVAILVLYRWKVFGRSRS